VKDFNKSSENIKAGIPCPTRVHVQVILNYKLLNFKRVKK
jgi:hypothetical protein